MEYYYVYNRKQALFFIQNGAIPIDIGVGKHRDVYHKFVRDNLVEKLNDKWRNNKE